MYLKSYREIFQDMRNYVIAHQDKITDFNEGSVASSMLEAPSRELSQLYNKTVSNIELYAQNMAYAQFDFERKSGIAATGALVFSRATPSVERSIPAGASVSTDDGLSFITTGPGKISAGVLNSEPIPAVCKEIGDTGNVRANKIKNIENTIYGVDTVNNPVAFSGGVNQETQEEYSARFTEFIIGLGKSSTSGVRSTGLSVNGIRSVSLVEHFPAEEGYHFTLFAEDGSGGLPAGLKSTLEQVIVGDDIVDGVRAAGIKARIMAPEIIFIDISMVFKVDGSIPAGLIEDDLITKITNYVNSRKIGEPYESKIVYNTTIKQSGVMDITTITPKIIEPTKRQIVRLGTIIVEGV